jgi:hypothetical protein
MARRIATFDVEPSGSLPAEPPRRDRYEIELTPDGPAGATGLDVNGLEARFPYH